MTDRIVPDDPPLSVPTAKATRAVTGTPPEPPRTAGSRLRRALRTALLSLPLVALVVWTLAPFLVTLSVSFKHRAEVFADPGLIPSSPNFEAYREVLTSDSFTSSFLNSVI